MTGPNQTRDPDSVLAAWLDEGPMDLPDATRRAILTALPTTQQARRGRIAPWRFLPMHTFARGAAVLVVAGFAIGALALLAGPKDGIGGPSPSTSPGASAAAAVDPCLVGTWTTVPLTTNSPADDEQISFSGGGGEVFTIDAQGGLTIDTHAVQPIVFVSAGETYTGTTTGTGRGTLTTSEPLYSGGPTTLKFEPLPDDTMQTTVVDSKGVPLGPSKLDLAFTAIYTCTPGRSFTFYKSAVFFMIDGSEVTLTAGDTSSTSTPALPALDATFVSPSYGYQIHYPTGWTVTPGTGPWPPGTARYPANPVSDAIVTPSGPDRVRISGASIALPSGTTMEQFRAFASPLSSPFNSDPCPPVAPLPVPLMLNAKTNPGASPEPVQAVVSINGCDALAELGGYIYDIEVIAGERGYTFTIDGHITTGDLLAWLATLELDPAGATKR